MSLIHEALEKLEREKTEKGKRYRTIPELADAERRAPALAPVAVQKNQGTIKSSDENHRVLYGVGGVLIFLFVLGLVYLFGQSSFQKNPSSPKPAPPSAPLTSLIIKSQFSLTGISQIGIDEYTAIINNQLVRVGDRVRGAMVKEILKDQVSLEDDGRILTLNLHGEDSGIF